MDNQKLSNIFQSGKTEFPLDEILYLALEIQPKVNLELIVQVHDQIQRTFLGNDPKFKAANTEYHDLRHTCAVVLATMRILHGLTLDGYTFSPDSVEQAVVSAYYHDTGLLITSCDTKTHHGAIYTETHEQRSILFMEKFLKGYGKNVDFINSCADIVACTSLRLIPDELSFPSDELELVACAVGSADILAQMADRCYLEQLPLLFKEKRVGGVNHYESVGELMLNTGDFYKEDVIKRLDGSFRGVHNVLVSHFRERWGIDKDLYRENIANNISYLKTILDSCNVELECIQSYLRRSPAPYANFTKCTCKIIVRN